MLCGSYCLYFFYLMEQMNYYDTILKIYFDLIKWMYLEVHLHHQSDNQIDTSNFVKKSYLKTNYIEANIEEDIDMKNHILY